jgi:hypothetical protein
MSRDGDLGLSSEEVTCVPILMLSMTITKYSKLAMGKEKRGLQFTVLKV